jgi:diaminopimelate decarboxylase
MSDLAQLPTPCYRYDLAEVRRCCAMLREALPQPSGLLYSLKANPHSDVVATLLAAGCGAEVSSHGELDAALTAGASPQTVLYTGPAKPIEDVRYALRAGVRRFSVDSATGVRQLAEAAREQETIASYLLRVNPQRAESAVGLAMTGTPSQFGADEDTIAANAMVFTAYPEAVFDGLHLYLATNLRDTEALMAQFRVALAAAVRLRETLGVPLGTLDLGGGFGAPFATIGELADTTGLAGALAAELDGTFPGWRDGRPEVVFESGRALTATCGQLITRVLDVKRSHGQRVVVVDSGIHHLGGMSGLRRVPPLRPDVLATNANAPASEQTMVCGPLCTPLDTWAANHVLPDVKPGDLLMVPNVGAYGLTASLALFLSHQLPVEVVVDGPRVVSMTRLRTHREVLAARRDHPSPVH